MINSLKVSSMIVKGVKQSKNVRMGDVLGGHEEGGTKTIRARTGVGMHPPKCDVNFRGGEGVI